MSRLFSSELNVATAEDCKREWCMGKPGERFRCGFCGHKFVPGDKWRGIYTNDMPDAGGNPLVCDKCDCSNANLRERWRQRWVQWREVCARFWWHSSRPK